MLMTVNNGSGSRLFTHKCSVMPNCGLRHPWDMLTLDGLEAGDPTEGEVK
jgi:hypothetical protein